MLYLTPSVIRFASSYTSPLLRSRQLPNSYPVVMQNLASYIRTIPDFPKPGIQFKDITTLMKDPVAMQQATEQLIALADGSVDKVVGIEARGFFFGPLIADRLSIGFIPIRKSGKLPAPTEEASYALEYGTDQLAIHQDAIEPGERILVHDDLLATGGTAQAACELVERLGGEVAQVVFLVELSFLNGRERLSKYPVQAAVCYDD